MKASTPPVLPSALKRFLGEYLPRQRAYSPHTILSYRDSLKLLLQFVAGKKRSVADLTVSDLSPASITAFLNHLEAKRRNGATTRNVRLAAVHSFFRFLGAEYPEHLEQTHRVLSIPFKRVVQRSVDYLEAEELRAVLSGIDRSTAAGRRDYALLLLLFNTGARVQEIVSLKSTDLHLTPPPSVKLMGKGRRERFCPLWPETVRLLRQHLAETGFDPQEPQPLFRNHRGGALTRFGIRFVLHRYVQRAAQTQLSLQRKRIHPHSVRHYAARRAMPGSNLKTAISGQKSRVLTPMTRHSPEPQPAVNPEPWPAGPFRIVRRANWWFAAGHGPWMRCPWKFRCSEPAVVRATRPTKRLGDYAAQQLAQSSLLLRKAKGSADDSA